MITCPTEGSGTEALRTVIKSLKDLELTVNYDKTKWVALGAQRGSFDFLGFHHYGVLLNDDKIKVVREPSRKAIQRLRSRIREVIQTAKEDEAASKARDVFRSWWSYFRISTRGNNSPPIKRTLRSLRNDVSRQLDALAGSGQKAMEILRQRRVLDLSCLTTEIGSKM
ncbi:MAG: hypothetical protein K6T81_02605 [Alicyclobacillus macrosporangiidus]|uniref:hypothetical protein n=1 Tax=Alicyclobacillus macrosporangiidus TaxID=392015 RepID=UPI0026EB7BED|nr:hypothetical protein [Alicyclobacillus macrosporangiidus]MCL6597616.1 hypothetical protein [Alicyclobacillus macrosporangiidus]